MAMVLEALMNALTLVGGNAGNVLQMLIDALSNGV
jgi:hypothetical protein